MWPRPLDSCPDACTRGGTTSAYRGIYMCIYSCIPGKASRDLSYWYHVGTHRMYMGTNSQRGSRTIYLYHHRDRPLLYKLPVCALPAHTPSGNQIFKTMHLASKKCQHFFCFLYIFIYLPIYNLILQFKRSESFLITVNTSLGHESKPWGQGSEWLSRKVRGGYVESMLSLNGYVADCCGSASGPGMIEALM